MATYTTHYNLKKPASGDYVNVADLNGNADIIDTELYDKVDKETGKGLSTNDYTTEEKTKLAGIESGAQVNPSAASANPLMDGTASAGSSASYARGDHVHPSDTTKVDKETGKGLSTNDYTDEDKAKLAELSQYVGAGVIFDTATGSMASFPDGGDGLPVKNVSVNVDPVQDLHGYSKPWTGGAGKNLLPCPYYNVGGMLSGVTITVNDNGSITLNGTSTNSVLFYLSNRQEGPFAPDAGTYILTGCPTGYSNYNLRIGFNRGSQSATIGNDTGSGATITETEGGVYYGMWIGFNSGATFNNLTIYPMVCKSTESDASWVPYSNICPITGHTSAAITRVGKNLLPMTVDGIKSANTTGTWSGNTYTRNGVTFTIETDSNDNVTGIKANGTASSNVGLNLGIFVSTSGVSYVLNGSPAESNVYIRQPGLGDDYGSGCSFVGDGSTNNYTVIVVLSGKVASNLIFKPMIRLASDPAGFEPYQGHVYNVTFPGAAGMVYGGTLDLNAGRLTVDKAYIASYSGQSINDPWISSMDEYAAGRTPTTGAQVVYPLTTPVTYNFTAEEITTLLGINHIWADTGDVSVEYAADPKLYINKVIANALNA